MRKSPPNFRGIWTDDLETRCLYSEGAGPYRIIPAAVAVPKDTGDVTTLVSFAHNSGTSLVPRGAGSGMSGGNVGTGILVDMREFNRPPAFVDAMSVRASAACTWADVDLVASKRGLRLPPDPASKKFCTVGGMVANNAAGPRTLRYGSMRDWVVGLELITADGEVEWISRDKGDPGSEAHRRFLRDAAPRLAASAPAIERGFPRTTKNSSGYAIDRFLESGALIDLLIGSEGTLGFISGVEFRLARIPDHLGTLLVCIPDTRCMGEAIRMLKRADPSAVELLDKTFLTLARENTTIDIGKAAAVLLVDIEGDDRESVSHRIDVARFDLEGLASKVITAMTVEDTANLWSIRHAASPTLARLPQNRRSLQIIEDSCVPVGALDDYLERVKLVADRIGIEVVAFGHAGDGHLHVNALVDVDDPNLTEKLDRLLRDVTEIVAELGGTMSGEHGDGRLRTRSLEAIYGTEITGLFRSIKKAFDPTGILNPGVILPGLDPIADLKVGASATKIPDATANELRDMERNATWGPSPLVKRHDPDGVH